MRPKILREQKYNERIAVGFRFRFSAEVGRFLSGRSPGSEVAIRQLHPLPQQRLSGIMTQPSSLTVAGPRRSSTGFPFQAFRPPEIHLVISHRASEVWARCVLRLSKLFYFFPPSLTFLSLVC
jgi:hypothetical protein